MYVVRFRFVRFEALVLDSGVIVVKFGVRFRCVLLDCCLIMFGVVKCLLDLCVVVRLLLDVGRCC